MTNQTITIVTEDGTKLETAAVPTSWKYEVPKHECHWCHKVEVSKWGGFCSDKCAAEHIEWDKIEW